LINNFLIDAGAQGLEIAAHMQKDFSFTEVISTALTAGFATNSTEVTDVLKAAAEANVASQLGAMVIGASDKFDFKQLLDTLASAGIAAEINLSDFFSKTNIAAQLGQNTVNAVATAGVNKLVYNQQPNMEDIAAESLGTTIGTEVGEAVGEKLDVERRHLGIYTDAEMMSARREVEEKAV
jgi:hypothetical protein